MRGIYDRSKRKPAVNPSSVSQGYKEGNHTGCLLNLT